MIYFDDDGPLSGGLGDIHHNNNEHGTSMEQIFSNAICYTKSGIVGYTAGLCRFGSSLIDKVYNTAYFPRIRTGLYRWQADFLTFVYGAVPNTISPLFFLAGIIATKTCQKRFSFLVIVCLCAIFDIDDYLIEITSRKIIHDIKKLHSFILSNVCRNNQLNTDVIKEILPGLDIRLRQLSGSICDVGYESVNHGSRLEDIDQQHLLNMSTAVEMIDLRLHSPSKMTRYDLLRLHKFRCELEACHNILSELLKRTKVVQAISMQIPNINLTANSKNALNDATVADADRELGGLETPEPVFCNSDLDKKDSAVLEEARPWKIYGTVDGTEIKIEAADVYLRRAKLDAGSDDFRSCLNRVLNT